MVLETSEEADQKLIFTFYQKIVKVICFTVRQYIPRNSMFPKSMFKMTKVILLQYVPISLFQSISVKTGIDYLCGNHFKNFNSIQILYVLM